MKRIQSAANRLHRSRLGLGLVAALMLGLTGCYTQLATVDDASDGERAERTAYHSKEDAVWDLYEARREGLISRDAYEDQLQYLGFVHYGDPFFYYAIFGDPFYSDPRFGIGISRVRFHFAYNHLECWYYHGYHFYDPFFHDPFFHDPFFYGSRFSIAFHFGFGRPYYYRPYRPYYLSYGYGYYGTYTPYYYYPRYTTRYLARRSTRAYRPRGETIGRQATARSVERVALRRGNDGRQRSTVGRSAARSTRVERSTTRRPEQRGRVGRSAPSTRSTPSSRGTSRGTQRPRGNDVSRSDVRSERADYTPRTPTRAPDVSPRVERIPNSRLAPAPSREQVEQRIRRMRAEERRARIQYLRQRLRGDDRSRSSSIHRDHNPPRTRSVRSKSTRSTSRSVRSSSPSSSRVKSTSSRSSSRSASSRSSSRRSSGRGGN